MRLASLSWPDVAARAPTSILAVPIGSTEQHGPHLPLSTDTDIATALADGLAAGRSDVLVTPPIAITASGEHAGFAGTLSIGQPATEETLIELGRSADAFRGVLFVSTHGGNAEAVAGAVERLRAERRSVRAWSCAIEGGDAHAGRTETSLMLAIAPALVNTARSEPGNTQPLREILAALKEEGVINVSRNGVLGDPTGASVAEGKALLDRLTAGLVQTVDAVWPR